MYFWDIETRHVDFCCHSCLPLLGLLKLAAGWRRSFPLAQLVLGLVLVDETIGDEGCRCWMEVEGIHLGIQVGGTAG